MVNDPRFNNKLESNKSDVIIQKIDESGKNSMVMDFSSAFKPMKTKQLIGKKKNSKVSKNLEE